MWQYVIHPLHLINVSILTCESQNTENVILQRDITKENCIRCIVSSSKWTRVIICLTFTYVWCCTAKSVWNKDWWHRQPAKMLDANLFRLWLEHHQCWRDHLRSCVHAGGGHFEVWTHALTWMFIYIIRQNILCNCQCNLMHVTAILQLTFKAEVVFICIFGFSTFIR